MENVQQGGTSPRRHLSPGERRLVLQVERYFTLEKDNSGPLESVLAVQKRTSDACGISEKTLRRLRKKSEEDLDRPYKRVRLHPKTLDLSQGIKLSIRNIVYDMYKAKEYVTLKAILEKIKQKKLCDFGTNSLSIILKHMGFKYKKTNNRKVLCELSNVVSKRWQFLRDYLNNKKSELSRQVVFLDETWVFANGTSTKSSWQDDSNHCYSSTRASNGKRYIILHAGNEEGFVLNASLIFSSTKKTDDYHGNMDAEIFEHWFEEKLLKGLEKPSLIVLDNASYHTRLEEKFPTSSWKKEEIKEWLSKKNINHENLYLKSELLSKCREQSFKKKYVVDELALKYGHQVLRLPPYHCHYNAIELVWGISKNYYDKHACKNIGKPSVIKLWEEALSQVGKEEWQKCIEHTEKIIFESYETEQVIDEVRPLIITNDDDDDDDDSDESESRGEISNAEEDYF